MSDKGVLGSVCGFLKSLFSSSSTNDSCCGSDHKSTASPVTVTAATDKKGDGLTGVERYVRNKIQSGTQLTGVEKYIRNSLNNAKPLTGVEKYIRNKTQAKPLTGVEQYIRSKA